MIFSNIHELLLQIKILKMCRGVAQLVAYSLWERGVVSSSLAAPTIHLSIGATLTFLIILVLSTHHLQVVVANRNRRMRDQMNG